MYVATAVITCMTDAERPFLREAILSVQRQSVPCEVILIVLSDNSWIDELLREFPEVKVVKREPGWAGAARNDGVRAATTEFVAFLDGDDVWLPDKTQLQTDYLRQNAEDFVAVDHLLMNEAGKGFAYSFAKYLPMPSSWMVRRTTMLDYPFDPDVAFGVEDAEWWLRTWHSIKKCRIPQIEIRYRVRGASSSSMERTKRRKLAVANFSARPGVRPLVLAATYLLHRRGRRSHYLVADGWVLPPKESV
jgi:glycosyltransferase involved in cell wall biosynthesis